MKLIIATAAAMLALPSAAFAQAGPTSSATANASADIVAPLHISCTNMHFAQLAPIHTATTVVLPAQGTPLDDPDHIVVPGSRTNAQPSNCQVTGETGLSFHVSLPTSATLTHGSDSMTLDTFTISTDTDLDALNRVLEDDGSGGGLAGFGVGATLHVGGDQPAGLYSGPFTVSVQYN
jgi:hypothetical protein